MSATKRTLSRYGSILVLLAILWFPAIAGGAEREVAGMITEIHLGRGQVEVKAADSELWRAATPLLTLRPGDTVSTTEDARAVVVLVGRRASVRVDEATSPFTVPAPPAGRSRLQKGLQVLEASFDFLATTTLKDLTSGPLGTRAGVKPPVILTPSNGLVLPDSLIFEWRGSASSAYVVRISGPDGLVLERTNLIGTRFQYPRNAPPLVAGVRYRFQLLPAWSPPQDAWFELVDPDRARTIRDELSDLEEAFAPALPPATLATLRAGFLAANGLLHNARLGLLEEMARQPEEPTLHFLLGDLYARLGLGDEARNSFAEARFLLNNGAARAR
jgi:hypothetical protein